MVAQCCLEVLLNRQSRLIGLGCVVALVAVAGSSALAASWDSFKSAQITGINLDKPLQANVLDYTLAIDSNPTITVGSETYAVNWVQAFYVVSGTPDGTFSASDGMSGKTWSWDSKAASGQISGWVGKGNDRLSPGDSMAFAFAEFDPGSNPVTPGYHISYQVGGKSVTDWFKGAGGSPPPNTVPEPSTLVALGSCFGGLLIASRYRRSRRVN